MKLQVVNWRGYNDDESYSRIEIVPAQDNLLDIIEAELSDEEKEFWLAAVGEGPGHSFFINDDITIFDGEQMIGTDGKRYVIRIEEVPDVAQPR